MSAERLVGRATPEGTRRGAEGFAEGARTLGRTGLHCAPIGIATRRLLPDRAEHRRALADALRGGVTIVDAGRPDRTGAELLATVLAQLVQSGEVRRDAIVVVAELDVAAAHERETVEASLAKLGLEHLDVVVLAESGHAAPLAEPAGRDRWRRAFAALEHEASLGRIGHYGVAGRGLALPEGDPDHLALAELVEVARDLAGDAHRFAVAELPMNLLELGALTHAHARAGGRTTLQVAAAADIGVVAVRPLTAEIHDGTGSRRVKLASRSAIDPVVTALAEVRRLEGVWAGDLGKRIVTEDGRDDAVDLFRWGQELATAVPHIDGLARWQALRHEVIAPQIGQASAALLAALQGESREAFAAWWMQYGRAMHEAFTAIETRLRTDAWPIALGRTLDPWLPEPWRSVPLAGRALLTVLSAPIACACVTMRDPGAVWDLLALREHPIRLLSAAAGPVDLAGLAAQLAQIVGNAP